jgi:hypothetical protein
MAKVAPVARDVAPERVQPDAQQAANGAPANSSPSKWRSILLLLLVLILNDVFMTSMTALISLSVYDVAPGTHGGADAFTAKANVVVGPAPARTIRS